MHAFDVLLLEVRRRKIVEESASSLGLLKRRYLSAAGMLHWLHLPSSWLMTLYSSSCFHSTGSLEYYYYPVLYI